jgi:hypothetical protein
MIHDARVEVTCDNDDCCSSTEIELNFVYHGMSGRSGQYDHDDSSVEKDLRAEGWIVSEDHKHYCCEECSTNAEEED